MTALPVPVQTASLDDELCLALYLASRAMTATYRPALDELGLTYPQYLVLRLLWEGEVSSVSEVGARLHLESNTLSPLVKRLEAMGLVTKRRRLDDERAVEVELTRQGKAMRRRASGVPDVICSAVGMDAAAMARLVKRLRKLTDDLESAGA